MTVLDLFEVLFSDFKHGTDHNLWTCGVRFVRLVMYQVKFKMVRSIGVDQMLRSACKCILCKYQGSLLKVNPLGGVLKSKF